MVLELNIFIVNLNKFNLFFKFYIYFFRPINRIFYIFLIQKAIVINLNFIILLILFFITFSQYSKLFYMPTSLKLDIYSLIKVVLDKIIFFDLFKSILHNIKRLK